MRRRIALPILSGLGLAALLPFTVAHTRRQVHSLRRELARRAHYLQGVTEGWRYWRQGRHPAWKVSDAVLVDRIRSELGPVEKRLDIPRVHVMVKDHLATIHGDVVSEDQVDELVRAVEMVAGVEGVRPHLHVGLTRGETRPSESRAHPPPSPAFQRLVGAASGPTGPDATKGAEAVLSTLADRLPPGELSHLRAHLPADVRAFLLHQGPKAPGRIRHTDEFVDAVAAKGSLDPDTAETLVRTVLPALRALVPEEVADISAVLPAELRDLWNTPAPA